MGMAGCALVGEARGELAGVAGAGGADCLAEADAASAATATSNASGAVAMGVSATGGGANGVAITAGTVCVAGGSITVK